MALSPFRTSPLISTSSLAPEQYSADLNGVAGLHPPNCGRAWQHGITSVSGDPNLSSQSNRLFRDRLEQGHIVMQVRLYLGDTVEFSHDTFQLNDIEYRVTVRVNITKEKMTVNTLQNPLKRWPRIFHVRFTMNLVVNMDTQPHLYPLQRKSRLHNPHRS